MWDVAIGSIGRIEIEAQGIGTVPYEASSRLLCNVMFSSDHANGQSMISVQVGAKRTLCLNASKTSTRCTVPVQLMLVPYLCAVWVEYQDSKPCASQGG